MTSAGGQGHPHAAADWPLLVAWEVTRRCPMHCRHCRGSAREDGYSGELTYNEGLQLIDAISAHGTPILILTGGEPLIRSDIYDLAAHATQRGLRVVMSPCGPSIDTTAVQRMRMAGIQRISISLDGADAATHDTFRNVRGAFGDTLRGINLARDGGLEFQINTTVSTLNVAQLPRLLELCTSLGAVAFNPFFLVPTGRGRAIAQYALSPEQYEQTLVWIARRSQDAGIEIRTTCAPHYYRVLQQQGAPPVRSRGCLGGQGFVFISYCGILQPCGFLDCACGDLRQAGFDFTRLYRESPVFTALRDRSRYGGACGVCEYLQVCGGCRARAFEQTGDYLAAEPYCTHVPRNRSGANQS